MPATPFPCRSFLSFDEALPIARALNLSGQRAWEKWRKSGARPRQYINTRMPCVGIGIGRCLLGCAKACASRRVCVNVLELAFAHLFLRCCWNDSPQATFRRPRTSTTSAAAGKGAWRPCRAGGHMRVVLRGRVLAGEEKRPVTL